MDIESFLYKKLEQAANRLAESSDQNDTVTLDVPLLIRLLEVAREDIKSDEELHQVVEKIIAIRKRGTLTMDDYGDIVNKPNNVSQQQQPNNQPKQQSSELVLDDIKKLAGIR